MTDTVLISTAIGPALIAEIRRACDTLGIEPIEANDLGAATLPEQTIAIIAALPAGARKIPADVAAAAERDAGIKILLCSGEPMVKPTASLHGGRVLVLAPPYDRRRLVGCMRQLTGRELGRDQTDRHDHGESLRSDWWLAWARHPKHKWGIESFEADDLTIVLGATRSTTRSATKSSVASADRVAQILHDSNDRDRESKLATELGDDSGVIHLSPVVGEWLLFWPRPVYGLWLCSPWRIPARWSLGKIIATSEQRSIRVSAYPGDVLVAAVAEPMPPSVDRALNALVGGASDAYAILRQAAEADGVLSAVVEVR